MDIDLFISEVQKLGVEVNDEKLQKLEKYYELLILWNEKMNLTAITEKKLVYLKHFYDSLTLAKVINLNEIDSLCDIGTGAGFPGIVLKIFYPSIKLTLVDALNKRVIFLNEVIKELKLDSVETIHGRAEEYAKNAREKFDVVTARAVSSFNVLLEYSIPLVKEGKYFIAMRGSDDTLNSSKALELLNSKKTKIVSFKLPIEESNRTIILVQKNGKTSLKYPRKFTEIKKSPL